MKYFTNTARLSSLYSTYGNWVKVPAGKTVDRKGRPLLIKLKGKVEAFYL